MFFLGNIEQNSCRPRPRPTQSQPDIEDSQNYDAAGEEMVRVGRLLTVHGSTKSVLQGQNQRKPVTSQKTGERPEKRRESSIEQGFVNRAEKFPAAGKRLQIANKTRVMVTDQSNQSSCNRNQIVRKRRNDVNCPGMFCETNCSRFKASLTK